MKRTGMRRAAAAAVTAALLAGCGGASGEGPSAEAVRALSDEAQHIQVALPDFVATSSSEVQNIYRLAYVHRDVLRYMPCYCGCADEGHTSDLDCFLREGGPSGSIKWDPMGHT